jgi:hypothetical protein
MNFELRLEKPNVSRAWISAGTMGLAYFIGKTNSSEITPRCLLLTFRWQAA